MPPVAMKSKLIDSPPKKGKNTTTTTDCVKLKQPVCPKPRRPVFHVPEVLRPLRCSKHRNSCSPNDMTHYLIDSRVNNSGHNRNDDQAATCTGCSTPYYAGSPPSRTNNPLIYDEEFVNQMEMLSPYSCKNLPDKSSFTSASPV
ncbi:hypothetical protein V2J09_009893 [Rumex salicifolius]